MRCPYCKNDRTSVIDTRVVDEGKKVRRKRECNCGKSFITYEMIVSDKRDKEIKEKIKERSLNNGTVDT